jgi:hypothetical protein
VFVRVHAIIVRFLELILIVPERVAFW